MRRLLVTLAIITAVTAACSAGMAGPAATQATEPSSVTPTVATADAANATPGPAPLPLDAVLIEVLGTDDIDRHRWDLERDAEQRLIDCMAAAGFEFIVPEPLPPGPSEAELTSRSFAAQKGFGIIDDFRTWLEETDIEALRRDLNVEYVRTLTRAEIDRYFLTLEGVEPEPGRIASDPGCRGSAAEEAYAVWNDFVGLLPNHAAIAEERDTHPDWLAARAEWRECMLKRGYDYAEPDAIRSDVELRMNESVQSIYPDGRVPLVFEGGRFVLDPVVEPLLDELQRFEVTAAVANLDCTAPVADRFEDVEREVQQGFVDRNRSAIDELLRIAG